MEAAERRRVGLFLAASFAWSWAIAAVFVLGLGQTIGGGITSFFLLAYWIGPGLAALLVHKVLAKRSVLELGLRFGLGGWIFPCWLGPPIFMVLTVVLASLIPGIDVDPMRAALEQARASAPPDQLAEIEQRIRAEPFAALWKVVPGTLIAGVTLGALVQLGGEVGWRGFLPRQFADSGFWTVSGITGAISGIWLVPLALNGYPYPEHPEIGAAMIVLWSLLVAPIVLYIRLKSGSVIPISIFLGTMTAASGAPQFLLVGGDDLTTGVYGIPGLILLALIDVFVWWRLKAAGQRQPRGA